MKIFVILLVALFLACAPEKKDGEIKMNTGEEAAEKSSGQADTGEAAQESTVQADAGEDKEDEYGTIMEFLQQKGHTWFSVEYPDTKHRAL
jgi:hypothetical protein